MINNIKIIQQHITGFATYYLKVEKFNHAHLSQLNSYVAYYRAEEKLPDDNDPVGILPRTEKGKKSVEYALSGMDEKLFVSKYLLQLPSKKTIN